MNGFALVNNTYYTLTEDVIKALIDGNGYPIFPRCLTKGYEKD